MSDQVREIVRAVFRTLEREECFDDVFMVYRETGGLDAIEGRCMDAVKACPPTREGLSTRDRELIAEFLESVAHQLTMDGKTRLKDIYQVSNALKIDADGLWVEMAAREARNADGWERFEE